MIQQKKITYTIQYNTEKGCSKTRINYLTKKIIFSKVYQLVFVTSTQINQINLTMESLIKLPAEGRSVWPSDVPKYHSTLKKKLLHESFCKFTISRLQM